MLIDVDNSTQSARPSLFFPFLVNRSSVSAKESNSVRKWET